MLHSILETDFSPASTEIVDNRNTLLGVFSRSVAEEQHLFTRTVVLFIRDTSNRGLFCTDDDGLVDVIFTERTQPAISMEEILATYIQNLTSRNIPCRELGSAEGDRTFFSLFGCILPAQSLVRISGHAPYIVLDPVELRGILRQEPEKKTLLQQLLQEDAVSAFYPVPQACPGSGS